MSQHNTKTSDKESLKKLKTNDHPQNVLQESKSKSITMYFPSLRKQIGINNEISKENTELNQTIQQNKLKRKAAEITEELLTTVEQTLSKKNTCINNNEQNQSDYFKKNKEADEGKLDNQNIQQSQNKDKANSFELKFGENKESGEGKLDNQNLQQSQNKDKANDLKEIKKADARESNNQNLQKQSKKSEKTCSVRKTKKRTYATSSILNGEKYKKIFAQCPYDTGKIQCIYCKSSYIPRPCDIDKHLHKEKHSQNVKKIEDQKKFMEGFLEKGSKAARAEIIWVFLTVKRNLSFNFTDYASDVLPQMFPDSEIAQTIILNRKKVKLIIENVLLGTIVFKKLKLMKKLYSLALDFSRDVSNKNQLLIICHYFDPEYGKIRRTVYDIVEQNLLSGSDSFQTLINLLKQDGVKIQNMFSICTDNAANLISQEVGLAGRLKKHNHGIFNLICLIII